MKRAIDGVDIDIRRVFVAILGHKRFRKIDAGKAYECDPGAVRRNHVGKRKRYERSGESVGCQTIRRMVFQNPDNQIIGTVVEEDVGFGPENLGVPADEIWKRVEEA